MVILTADLLRSKGELFREGEDGSLSVVELGPTPVLRQCTDEILVSRSQTERRPVMFDSVVALVRA